MSKDQWADHRLLIDIRNQVISHVYGSRPIGQQNWHRSVFFAVEMAPGQWRPASSVNQISFDIGAFEALSRSSPIAYEIVKQKFFKRMCAVMDELGTAGSQELLLDCQFDPVEKFGSTGAVESVLGMEKAGTGAMWSRDKK